MTRHFRTHFEHISTMNRTEHSWSVKMMMKHIDVILCIHFTLKHFFLLRWRVTRTTSIFHRLSVLRQYFSSNDYRKNYDGEVRSINSTFIFCFFMSEIKGKYIYRTDLLIVNVTNYLHILIAPFRIHLSAIYEMN